MTSRYEVTLGGVKLSTIDKNLLILDVSYTGVQPSIQTYNVANLEGYDVSKTYYEKQTVTVTFELHIYDTAKRNEALQSVNAWAGTTRKTLQINDRKNQYLSVRCTQYATLNSVRNWTDPITIVFETDYIPFWMASTQKTLTLSGTTPSGTLKMDGNIGNALVTIEATANVAITSFKAVVGSTNVELKSISVPSGKTVVIDYIHERYLRVRANGSSVMSKLATTSTDRLLAPCGADTKVSIAASGKVTATVKARGMWL